jgi:hypothetical protein
LAKSIPQGRLATAGARGIRPPQLRHQQPGDQRRHRQRQVRDELERLYPGLLEVMDA